MRTRQKIFCIGLNKTGTTSLKQALRDLGCRFGSQAQGELLIKPWLKRDFQPILDFADTSDCFKDIPFSLPFTYIPLAAKYPDAKFILTVRDSAEQWYESFVRNAIDIMDPHRLPTIEDMKNDPYRYTGWHYDVHVGVIPGTETDPFDRAALTRFYKHYMHDVRSFFRNDDRLLTINVARPRDYLKMCRFLEVEPRAEQFPHLNQTPRYDLRKVA